MTYGKKIFGNNVIGFPYWTLGSVYGQGVKSVSGYDVFEFAHNSVLGDTHQPFDFQLHYNGMPFAYFDKDDPKQSQIYPLKPSSVCSLDVLPTQEPLTSANFFYVVKSGSGVKVKINESTTSDFYSYLIYWDAGVSGGSFVQLAELIGIKNTVYLVSGLTSATAYTFRVYTKDKTGNINNSEYQERTIRITDVRQPLPYATLTWSYSKTTRKLTITGTHSLTQNNQYRGAHIYTNYLLGFGLQKKICYQKDMAHFASDSISGSGFSYTSNELTAGVWGFGICGVSAHGLETETTEKYYSLAWVDGELIGTAITYPQKPTNITAISQSGGDIAVSVYYDYVLGESINLYRDGVLIDTVSKNISGVESWTFEGLTDAQTYEFYATSSNSYAETAPCFSVFATADSTPPDDVEFILELV